MFIKEVFADKADELVFKSKSNRFELIQNFLQNRVEVRFAPELKGKKFKSLDEVALENKFNPNMKRDVVVTVATFNPLKYNVPMFPKEKEIYRISDSDYLLILSPDTNIIN